MAKADVQRARVYRWERRCLPEVWNQRITEDGARELMKEIADSYQIPVPSLEVRYLGSYAGDYRAFDNRLRLAPISGLNRGTVLHEMAHAVCAAWKKRLGKPVVEDGGHGDFFMRSYLDVLSRFAGWTQEQLTKVQECANPNLETVGWRRRAIPKVAACQVFEDPAQNPDQARRSMRCLWCDYPWVRHDMPFHKHDCAEQWLESRGHRVPGKSVHSPKFYRSLVVTTALRVIEEEGWTWYPSSYGKGRWRDAGYDPKNYQGTGLKFVPTTADHTKKAQGLAELKARGALDGMPPRS